MALTTELFGRSLTIPQIRPRHFEISGRGLSCWNGYAQRLRLSVNFTNTFLHREPRFDITEVLGGELGTLDFLVASEVFEHVAPPVDIAFRSARRLLKDDGVFIITVPFTNPGEESIPMSEHFPDLFNYKIKKLGTSIVLENITRDGVKQVYTDLKFHGGPGSTLEMRIFSESSLIEALFDAGFNKINVFGGSDLAHGIYWKGGCSVPLSARVKDAPVRIVRSPKPYAESVMRRKGAAVMSVTNRVIAKFHRFHS